jgi:hypothetical protein
MLLAMGSGFWVQWFRVERIGSSGLPASGGLFHSTKAIGW